MTPAIRKASKKAAKAVKNPKFVTAILVIVVVIFFRKKLKNAIENFRRNRFDRNEGSDVNSIVQQYRSAVNPSGVSWLIDVDGTNEEEVLRLAEQSKGQFQEVARAYRAKFNESITDRMRSDLSVSDFAKWQDLVA